MKKGKSTKKEDFRWVSCDVHNKELRGCPESKLRLFPALVPDLEEGFGLLQSSPVSILPCIGFDGMKFMGKLVSMKPKDRLASIQRVVRGWSLSTFQLTSMAELLGLVDILADTKSEIELAKAKKRSCIWVRGIKDDLPRAYFQTSARKIPFIERRLEKGMGMKKTNYIWLPDGISRESFDDIIKMNDLICRNKNQDTVTFMSQFSTQRDDAAVKAAAKLGFAISKSRLIELKKLAKQNESKKIYIWIQFFPDHISRSYFKERVEDIPYIRKELKKGLGWQRTTSISMPFGLSKQVFDDLVRLSYLVCHERFEDAAGIYMSSLWRERKNAVSLAALNLKFSLDPSNAGKLHAKVNEISSYEICTAAIEAGSYKVARVCVEVIVDDETGENFYIL